MFIEGFPCGSARKESACNVEDLSLIPGFGRSPGEGKGYPLQYSGLENYSPWGCKELDIRLSDFHFTSVFIEEKKKDFSFLEESQVHSKIEWKGQRVPIHTSHPHPWTTFPLTNMSHQRDMLITVNGSTSLHQRP